MNILKNKNYNYLKIFLWGTALFYLIILPMVVYNKGIFLYYGDFNSQQIPFYQLAHNAVRNGNFLWNWNTDLGANFIGSYSFYLLGSPFFWLTVPFPDSTVPYLIPILLSLKYGTATVTAFAYIKRFVKTEQIALIGGLLYAFSGFQAYNVFFNHFHDATAFFPLLLIAMEEKIQNNRKGVFALTVALCAMVSYFFFEGEVIFCIIYFIVRCFCPDFKITLKKFLSLAFEAIVGVMISAFLLLPSLLAIMGNPRTAERLTGSNLISYSDNLRIFRIIQSFFMLPDPPAYPNLFDSSTAKWSSIAGYLPMFSMAGVLAFMKSKPKHFASRIIKICIIFAFIPVLNSFFSGFTSSYYARWFFMPVLIMAMMTAYSLDNSQIDYKQGFIICGIVLLSLGIYSVMPKETNGIIEWFRIPQNITYFWICLVFTAAALGLGYFVFRFWRGDALKYSKIIAVTSAMCFLSTGVIVWFGISRGPYPEPFINEAINGADNISLPESEFYRIDISDNKDNYPMSWGIPSIRAFQSVVPVSIMEFYPTIGVTRDVASRPDRDKYGLYGLFSVKYYFNSNVPSEDEDSDSSKDKNNDSKIINIPGFEYYDTQNNFTIYENKYYVPMGFTFDYYISQEKYEERDSIADKLLMKALVLDNEQIEKYSHILRPLPANEIQFIDLSASYLQNCQDRKANACTDFTYSTEGFSANISLDKENLVFFSVPYDKGFTAYVDGEKTDIEKVDIGFMAVDVKEGNHTIEFRYTTPGLYVGFAITVIGVLLLAGYLIIFRNKKSIHQNNSYDY